MDASSPPAQGVSTEPSHRMLFLQQFTRALIASTPMLQPSSFAPESEEPERVPEPSSLSEQDEKGKAHTEEHSSSVSPEAFPMAAKSGTQSPGRHVVPSQRRRGMPQRPPLLSFQFAPHAPAAPLPYRVPSLVLHRRPPPPKIYLAPPTESWLATMQSLSRIQSLLKDPTITFIDCLGPGIPIMIARGSLTQSTPFHFSTEEIDSIIRDISERTHIPLSPTGIFKAAIGNVVITALLSEFVGTRFVIQKKKPPEVQPQASTRQ